MLFKRKNIEKTKGQAKSSVIDNLIERYPAYRSVLISERGIYESFKTFPKTKEQLRGLVHLADCLLSGFVAGYRSFDNCYSSEACLDHIWDIRGTFKKGREFLPWFKECVLNYGRDCIKEACDVVGFDSSDLSDDGLSIRFGYHSERNRITEKVQFSMGAYQMDFLSEETALELEREYIRKKSALRESHLRQIRAEKKAFDKALNRALSEIRPQSRLFHDLYNQGVSFNVIFSKIGAATPGAARGRRNELVKSMERKIARYWQAPKGYLYDDPLQPLRRQLMEITFFKGRNKNENQKRRSKI